jgi:acetyl-CoA carboxylase/biotin carboxylase 1
MPMKLILREDVPNLGKSGELVKTRRFPGANKIGMLAWITTLKTPQYPEGREVVFIANDVTVQSGSFGVLEDEFFFKASEYARERGLPRVFISCNSGARIGLVEDLKPKFKVAWKDEARPELGFEYLYLSDEDFKEKLETLNGELETLNAQARDLEHAIAGNVAEILEA